MNSKLIGVLIVLNLIVVSMLGMVMVTFPLNEENVKDEINALPMMTFAPIIIINASGLQNMSLNLSVDYELGGDIDCTGTSSWNSGKGFDPVGNGSGYFNGTLDGKGFKIINLGVIRSYTDYRGLFGFVGKNASIKDVTFENVLVRGGNYTGALAGFSMGTIDNCEVTSGFVTSWRYVGGLVGRNDGGQISNSSTQCKVTAGTFNIGGLIGYNYYGNITNCFTTGDTEGDGGQHGGLMGNSKYGIIKNCYATGKVTGSSTSDIVGGLIGNSEYDKISDCYSTGDVDAYDYVGGFVGIPSYCTITNCYATGAVTATGEDIGGFVGELWKSDIIDCYATGDVDGDVYVGGLVGDFSTGHINNSYSTGRVTTSDSYAGGLVGYFAYGEINDCYHTGDLDITADYGGGLVGWLEDSVLNNSWSKGNFTPMTGDYYGGLVGQVINSQVTNSSAETKITGDNADSEYLGGLVGGISDGKIYNCFAIAELTGGYGYMGGLVGDAYGSPLIDKCYSEGSVKSTGDDGYFAGLVGSLSDTSVINNSYSTASVENMNYDSIGGLIGWAGTSTKAYNSYATGDVRGDGYIGGFVGSLQGLVQNCYSTGDVISTGWNNGGFGGRISGTARINNSYSTGNASGGTTTGGFIGELTAGTSIEGCYFDSDTSRTTDALGSGSTTGITSHNTTMMKKQSTFKPPNWDFVNIWGMIEDKTYPFLRPFYNPPRVLTTGIPTATEDLYYSTAIEFALPTVPAENEYTISYTTNGKSWLTYDNVDTFSGIPTNANVGSYWIDINISDIVGSSDSKNLTLQVINVNDPPEITTPISAAAVEDLPFNVDYNAVDIDPTNDILTWNMTPSVSWLSFDDITGIMTGTPSNDDVGDVFVTLKVDDGNGDSDKAEFTLTVVNVNDAPVITTTDVKSVMVDEAYSVDYDADDVDPTSDVLHWSLLTQAAWLAIDNNSGQLTGTPTSADIGTWKVTVMVNDGNGGVDLTTFDLVVNFVNHAPSIIDDAITKITNEDALYYFDFEATDADLPSDMLTWSIDTDAGWLSFDTSTGVCSGTPGNDDVGTYQVEVRVEDENDANDTTSYELQVVNVNDAPVISTTDVTTATEDSLYSVDYDADDIDPGADTLTWKLDGAPPWLEIDAVSGDLSGTPTNADVGKAPVTVKVEDGNGGSDSTTFVLTVANVNDAPEWVIQPDDANMTEGMKFAASAMATDIDLGDTITYGLTSDPTSGISIDTARGIMIWNSTLKGSYLLNVTASDGTETIWYEFALAVTEKGVVTPPAGDNDPPTIEPVAEGQKGKAGSAFKLTISGSDPDEGDDVEYELEDAPSGMVISNDGEILWVPSDSQVGEHTVVVVASDGINETKTSFTITVSEADKPSTTDGGDEDTEAQGLESPSVSIPIGIIIGIILGIIIGMVMRGKKKAEETEPAEEEAEEEELDDEEAKEEDDDAEWDEEEE